MNDNAKKFFDLILTEENSDKMGRYLENVLVDIITNKDISFFDEEIKNIIFTQNKKAFLNKRKQISEIDECYVKKIAFFEILSIYYEKLKIEDNYLNKYYDEYITFDNLYKKIIILLYKENNNVKHRDLAKKLNVSSSAISQTIKKNEKYNFIVENRINERVIYYNLTSVGKNYIRQNENKINFNAYKKGDQIWSPLIFLVTRL